MTERQEQLMSLLNFVGPMTRIELERLMDLSENAVMKTITQLKKQNLIRIVEYERSSGRMKPVYGSGSGADARMPKAISSAEKNKKYRANNTFLISIRRYVEYNKSMGPWAGLMR